MLPMLKSSKSTAIIFDVIRDLTGDTTYAIFDATISAMVGGVLKIDNDVIRVQLTNSRPNYALIDVMWEDYGYKNYRDMGLFGRMSTQWQEVKKLSAKEFRVLGDGYQLDITYK